MPEPKACKARQHGDQMNCSHCGTIWDTNDPDPPECMMQKDANKLAADTQMVADAHQMPEMPKGEITLDDFFGLIAAQINNLNARVKALEEQIKKPSAPPTDLARY
jgi:hypothetical protein